MDGIYTEQELIDKIKALDAKIEAASDVQGYTFNSGFGSQTVQKRSIAEMIRLRKEYLAELSRMRGDGLMTLGMERW